METTFSSPAKAAIFSASTPALFPGAMTRARLSESLFQLGQGSPAPVPFHILQVQLLGIGPVKAAPLFRSHGVEDLINILHREGVLLREE